MTRTRAIAALVALSGAVAAVVAYRVRRVASDEIGAGYVLGDYLVTGQSFEFPPVPDDVFNNLKRSASAQGAINDAVGGRGYITSGWRPPDLNEAIGGVATSSHLTGLGTDRRPVLGDSIAEARAAVEAFRAQRIDWDQVIAYHPTRGGHVHVGLSTGKGRKQLLLAGEFGGYVTLED